MPKSFLFAGGVAILIGLLIRAGERNEKAENGKPPAAKPEEAEQLGVGDWSEPVRGLKGRLLLYQGRVLGDGKTRETLVYVELRYAPEAAGEPISVHFDPDQLKCALHDADGKAVPEHPGGGSGGRPGKGWVTLPYDSTLRLRVNPYAFGRAKDVGLLIPLNHASWLIKTGDAGDYFLSGTLAVNPPKDHGRANAWQGELKLPNMKVALKANGGRALPAPAEPTQNPKAGEWSERKDGIVARLRLVKDDENKSVRVLLEVNNYTGLGGGIAFPGEPQVELSVLDADGKPLKTAPAAVSIGRAADPADAVIPGTSCLVFRIDRVFSKTGLDGYLLLVNEAWVLEAGKQYTVKGKVISNAKSAKGWGGPLDLPAVVFNP
jgi:hypothetical protein